MLACGNLQSQLEHLAEDLRPTGRQFIPVLQIAHRLGVRVCIRFQSWDAHTTAHIELAATPPTIYLSRPSSTIGLRRLQNHEDLLLTPRERFSVAHELGHLVAFRELHVSPALERSQYWVHEQCMHSFAATLLMPGQLIEDWLGSCPAWEPISPFALRHWARNIAKVSEEVVAKQLCLKRPEIGFIKVVLTKRSKDESTVLRVLFGATGERLALPKTHSHINNKHLLQNLSKEDTGSANIQELAFGEGEPQDVRIAWRHAGFLKEAKGRRKAEASGASAPIFWISVASQKREAGLQLPLWQIPPNLVPRQEDV